MLWILENTHTRCNGSPLNAGVFLKVCNRSIDQTLHHYPSEQYYFVYASCSHLATFCCRRNWNRLSWQFIFAHDQNSDERPYLVACVVLLVYSFLFLVWGDFLNYHWLVYHEIPIRCLRVNKKPHHSHFPVTCKYTPFLSMYTCILIIDTEYQSSIGQL